MKSVGIVAEYNPFHNGHLYQLQAAKEETNSSVVIVVMSGPFLQRGEPALVTKWTRTKMALLSGADIVVELPYALAVQKAETFAYGAIYLLNALKCNNICFGSESGNIREFHETVRFLHENNHMYNDHIKKFIKEGISYPSALSLAYKQLNPENKTVDLSKPNNILGYHYMSAGSDINPDLQFFTIERRKAHYHDQTFNETAIASATAIRKGIHIKNDLSVIKSYVPKETYSELEQYQLEYGKFHDWENYWPFLQYRLLSMDIDEIRGIYEVEEGLEYRLKNAAQQTDNFQSFMSYMKTKRYTWTRLQRIATHILTNTKKETIKTMGNIPQYIRLLGLSKNGRIYLNQVKKQLDLPVVSKVSAFRNKMLSLDMKAGFIYGQVLSEPFRSQVQAKEYSQPPIMI